MSKHFETVGRKNFLLSGKKFQAHGSWLAVCAVCEQLGAEGKMKRRKRKEKRKKEHKATGQKTE